jgi:hypothetical protein
MQKQNQLQSLNKKPMVYADSWVYREELRMIKRYRVEMQLSQQNLMGLIDNSKYNSIVELLNDNKIKIENMTLSNIFAFAKLGKEESIFKKKDYNVQTLSTMLQSEDSAERDYAEAIINQL